jgi:hypothetical protein
MVSLFEEVRNDYYTKPAAREIIPQHYFPEGSLEKIHGYRVIT